MDIKQDITTIILVLDIDDHKACSVEIHRGPLAKIYRQLTYKQVSCLSRRLGKHQKLHIVGKFDQTWRDSKLITTLSY